MRSFATVIITLVTIGHFALTTSAAPWKHPSKPETAPSPAAAPVAPAAPAVTTSTTTTSSTTSSKDTTSGSDSSGSGSGTSGQAVIVNKCSFAVYMSVCLQHPATCVSTTSIPAATGTYAEAYAPSSEGGRSIKIMTAQGDSNQLQFEYTNEGNGKVSYDLSEVNGNPFGSWGFTLTNTTTDAYCAPPANVCPAIFTAPTNGIPYTCDTSDGIGAIICG